MGKRNRWEPRPLLQENPWSLIPSIGLTKPLAWITRGLWVAITIMSILTRPVEWQSTAGVGLLGILAMFYITQRLGAREATLGAGVHVTPDSPFEIRLLADSLCLFMLLFAVVVLLFGMHAVRALLGNS